MTTPAYGAGIEISGRITPEYAEILTPEAVAFAAKLQRAFGGRRAELLAKRAQRQAELDAGKLPDFLPETRAIREGDWTVRRPPPDIHDRRVEITGPVDRKMVINALNSGATCSWPTSRTPTRHAGTTTSRASSTCATRSAARIDLRAARRQGSTS